MTTATTQRTPAPLLSTALRAGIAAAAVAFVAGVWAEAGQSSHHAVQEAQANLSRVYVTLPRVEIVMDREAAQVASIGARRTPAL